MSFRMRNIQQSSDQQDKDNVESRKEIDLFEEKYKELRSSRFFDGTQSSVDKYRKNLVQPPSFVKETIIYDQISGKWKLVKSQDEEKKETPSS